MNDQPRRPYSPAGAAPGCRPGHRSGNNGVTCVATNAARRAIAITTSHAVVIFRRCVQATDSMPDLARRDVFSCCHRCSPPWRCSGGRSAAVPLVGARVRFSSWPSHANRRAGGLVTPWRSLSSTLLTTYVTSGARRPSGERPGRLLYAGRHRPRPTRRPPGQNGRGKPCGQPKFVYCLPAEYLPGRQLGQNAADADTDVLAFAGRRERGRLGAGLVHHPRTLACTCHILLLDRRVYEVIYEARNRPNWPRHSLESLAEIARKIELP
jgi:hypothetical protein